MKTWLVILLYCGTISTLSAQLEKGAQIAGIQINAAINDALYSARPAFNISDKNYGLSIAIPTAWALERNWLMGIQATIGIETEKHTGSFITTHTYTDLGISSFTRLYFDISKSRKWKLFGLASIEMNNAKSKTTYDGSGVSTNTRSSNTNTVGAFGGGIAYFNKKISLDISMSTTALRLGIYRVFAGLKK